MKIEIAIEGPWEALKALREKFPAGSEKSEQGTRGFPLRGKWVLIEEDDRVDQCLIRLSEIADTQLHIADQLEFRVRNLAYSEPTWADETLREPFQPIPGLTIRPWGPCASSDPDPRGILLGSDFAFGTGRHPTTQLCLKALVGLSCGPWGLKGKSILDFGCGSGVLVIAAVKLGASHGQGVEIDSMAARTARRNVALNGLTERIVISEGSWEAVQEKTDLIFANVVPAVLVRTGSEISFHLRHYGRAVVSGFGQNRSKEMEAFFSDFGWRVTDRLECRGWGGLIMERVGGRRDPRGFGGL